MDYTRQRDWFDPSSTNAAATVVGCGGIGSFAAFALAKLGVQIMDLVDFDTVEEHNVPNQLFMTFQTDLPKVVALANNCGDFSGVWPVTHNHALGDGVPLNDVVISALDSMEARAELWQQVKYKLGCKLFLDARLGGQNVVLYSANPCVPSDIEGYEATLYSDDEADDDPCTARSIIDVGFVVGSLITRAVRRHYAQEPATPVVFLNQSTLDIYKGEWTA